MLDLAGLISHLHSLSLERPIFHSEADFQHALAWRFRCSLKNAEVRLEKPFKNTQNRSRYLDLLLMVENRSIAFELKYKTRNISCLHNDETFQVQNHGAQDLGRYDFLSDVQKLEKYVSTTDECERGYAILLTNDPSYWCIPSRTGTVDENFRLYEGREITGELSWLGHASAGTKRGRGEAIKLRDQYSASWKDFTTIPSEKNGRFRFLAWEVK